MTSVLEGAPGASQIAGFVFSATSITYRWAPNHATVWTETTGVLQYTLPQAAVSLLDGLLRQAVAETVPVDVHRLLDGRCLSMGPFLVTSWEAPVVCMTSSRDPEPDPSVIEVLSQWGVDVVDHPVEYPIGIIRYQPDLTLYDVLHAEVVEWCGPQSRFGSNCLAFCTEAYPSRERFAAARQLAKTYRYAVILVFGRPTRPTGPDDVSTNGGLQVILFQPGTGVTQRVHFAGPGPRIRLRLGELGDME